MKDIPMFTTEYGAASLILRELPYRGIAYVRLQATEQPEKLLEECIGFCRAFGFGTPLHHPHFPSFAEKTGGRHRSSVEPAKG